MRSAEYSAYIQERRPPLPTLHITLCTLSSTEVRRAAGIVVNDDGLFTSYKDQGLVNDVFTPDVLAKLGEGNIAVGHVRYGTTGASDRLNSQPIVVNHIKGRMALAHNGNLINSFELREELELKGSIFHTTSRHRGNFVYYYRGAYRRGSIEEAVAKAARRAEGQPFSLVIMSPTKLIAARDPHGFRPLCYGETADGSVVFASESCALDSVGAKLIERLSPVRL